ncbi:MAG: hypothetical protein U1G07_20160 [Verrucomicrobiota bacterium]
MPGEIGFHLRGELFLLEHLDQEILGGKAEVGIQDSRIAVIDTAGREKGDLIRGSV